MIEKRCPWRSQLLKRACSFKYDCDESDTYDIANLSKLIKGFLNKSKVNRKRFGHLLFQKVKLGTRKQMIGRQID